MRVIISGGGTGGHVFPAIAIANAVKEIKPEATILFVGAKGKLEMEKVPKAGYPIEGLWISGIDRKLTKRNFLFPFKLLMSLWKARKIIKRFRPDIAVGVGGYASGPVLYQAALQGIPTLIQEQNSYAGITNKLLAKKVDKVCVAYEGMQKFFPGEKILYTGNPVRKEIAEQSINVGEAKKSLGFHEDYPTVLVFGGSLGARTLNEAIAAGKDLINRYGKINVLWQVGKLYYSEFSINHLTKLPTVRAQAFIEDMPTAYAIADVVVCRAGALTISELQVVGKPAILVPSPNVAEDHQTKNAQALVDQGAALMIRDGEAKEKLVGQMLALLEDKEHQQQLRTNILKMKKEDAAIKIAEEIIKLTM